MSTGYEKVVTPGGKEVTYHFKDELFPARELIEPAINAAGYELDESYSGTSRDHYLAELFIESIKLERLEVMESTAVSVSPTSSHQTLDALILRFDLSKKEEILALSILKSFNQGRPSDNKITFGNISDLHYIVLASIILGNSAKTLGSATFFTITQSWKEIYNSNTLAPVVVLRNAAETLGVIGADRNFMNSDFMKNSSYENIVYLACKFTVKQINAFRENDVRAEQVIVYMRSGFTEFQNILEFAIAMPEEWFNAFA